MTVRADVVSLLHVTDLETVLTAGDPAGWKRRDGTPLTVEEQALVSSANRAELIAARDFSELAMRYAAEEVADMDRLMELCDPYFRRLPDGATFGHVEPLMTESERRAMREILDRLAPDGYLIIGKEFPNSSD